MSETNPSGQPKAAKTEVIEEAVVVEDPTTREPEVLVEPTTREPEVVVVESVEPAPAAYEVPTETVAAESTPLAGPQVIYVQAPTAPARKGNRGVGAAIAVASGLIFFAVFTLIAVIINLASGTSFSFAFLGQFTFYVPTLFFIVGFVILVLLANRANWWAYIFGSILVALFVYFGTIGAVMLTQGVILLTPEQAAGMFEAGLVNPLVVAGALLAREVSLWTGSIIARRGRKVAVRNAEAREAWEREVAEQKAEYDRLASAR